jgi:hypothetical protein
MFAIVPVLLNNLPKIFNNILLHFIPNNELFVNNINQELLYFINRYQCIDIINDLLYQDKLNNLHQLWSLEEIHNLHINLFMHEKKNETNINIF